MKHVLRRALTLQHFKISWNLYTITSFRMESRTKTEISRVSETEYLSITVQVISAICAQYTCFIFPGPGVHLRKPWKNKYIHDATLSEPVIHATR